MKKAYLVLLLITVMIAACASKSLENEVSQDFDPSAIKRVGVTCLQEWLPDKNLKVMIYEEELKKLGYFEVVDSAQITNTLNKFYRDGKIRDNTIDSILFRKSGKDKNMFKEFLKELKIDALFIVSDGVPHMFSEYIHLYLIDEKHDSFKSPLLRIMFSQEDNVVKSMIASKMETYPESYKRKVKIVIKDLKKIITK